MSQNIIKAEFEADYIMAYRFRQGLSDLVYSTDADMSALCGPLCVSIRSFGEEKSKKKRKKGKGDDETSSYIYEISGGSNTTMNTLKTCIHHDFPDSKVIFNAAKYPLLDNDNPLTLALSVVGIGCDVLPGGIPGVTPLSIWNELKRTKDKEKVRNDEHGKKYKHLMMFMLKKIC